MDALPFAATTPTSVARVGLRARDADALAAFYRDLLGLQELFRDGGEIRLGAGERELLAIQSDPAARPDDPRSAGLFHTAFLLPSRADLGRWIGYAAARRFPLTGASDHLVSEALYLDDPEGNGIEVYADRAPEVWSWEAGQVGMATAKLDVPAVMASVPAGDPGWRGAPENTVIGHVHLRVGDPQAAEAWWHETFGFDTVARYGSAAVFMSSGGYHHHVGANSWRSAGAGRRGTGSTGLSFVEFETAGLDEERSFEDPWGTLVRQVPRRRR